MTYKQAKSLGAQVRKGENATPIIFWNWIEKEDRETKKKVKIPVLKHYNVFSELQCDGIELTNSPKTVVGIDACEQIKSDYLGRETSLAFEDYRVKPFYLLGQDIVNVPEVGSFKSKEAYYSTMFHELVHSTGHESRLDRGLTKVAPYGSKDYSKEELIAELRACFLSGFAGIEPETIDDSASYLDGWIKVLKGDSKLLIQAAGKAQNAVDYILSEGAPGARD